MSATPKRTNTVLITHGDYVEGCSPYFLYAWHEKAEPMGRKTMDKKMSPLLVLAETAMTKDEVIRQLRPLAEKFCYECLLDLKTEPQARNIIRSRLNSYIDKHWLSGFQRKRTVDKTTKRVLGGYSGKLDQIKLALTRVEKEHESCTWGCCKHQVPNLSGKPKFYLDTHDRLRLYAAHQVLWD